MVTIERAEPPAWSDPRDALASAVRVLGTPPSRIPDRLSEELSGLFPHRALAILTGNCARSPMRTHGDPVLTERITSAELARLAGSVDVGVPYAGTAIFGGRTLPVLAAASAPHGSAGALLVLVPRDNAEPGKPVRELVQHLWNATCLHLSGCAAQAHPEPLASNRAAAGERARVIAELTDAHSAALTALLGALRSRRLDDAAARQRATELAVSALIEARATGELDRALSEEKAGEAFALLTERLNPLTRYTDVTLDLMPPRREEQPLPSDVANTARAVARSVVLIMLEQETVSRIRVAWHAESGGLRIDLRDDGPGTLAPDALAIHRLTERVASLGGTVSLEAVPGWGSTMTATLPLSAPETSAADPLACLKPREIEVLECLAHGHRNRRIAEQLQISENTVKFHVANILHKLSVASRGEAAALARTAAALQPPPSRLRQ